MLVKDEMKFEQKLNQYGEKMLPNKKDRGGRKKKLIALREVKHMLDEVATRRHILCKENEETRKAITSMRQALTAMPKAIQEERAKLMSKDRQTKEAIQRQGGTMKMVNENIRETLYAMHLTMSSMPIIVAASTSSSMSQHALCNTLLNTYTHPSVAILPKATTVPVPAVIASWPSQVAPEK
ncbi:expressed unknown protein [Seminavis robusta]|uniref:Uncharacterized protein n=1 Tax=Seminavis robusta TaxID=568900 RepID=A0A9N8HVJ8_9STRA|nr:expressed unknown protein [Seminavis robusta]|eukprot:Sro1997_g310090.1 n/a (182) ;mRNA; r:8048-8593